MSLRNRVALVTGGTRGIGRGLALRLAQEGARIAIAYRSNKVAAQQALRQLQAGGADCDIRRPVGTQRQVQRPPAAARCPICSWDEATRGQAPDRA